MQRSRPRQFSRQFFFLVASAFCIFLFWIMHRGGTATPPEIGTTLPLDEVPAASLYHEDNSLPCRNVPGAEDVLVVMKTGATELEDKLPIHLKTTLRCYPQFLIFSDYEETYHGVQILDALEHVNSEIKEKHQDFELWRRLQRAQGRSTLLGHELSGPISRPQGMTGKPSNAGWKLDKWKFLPMVNRTLNECPDKKWYVFVETDSYVMWQTLLNNLRALDWTTPYYMGGQIWIGDVEFAHGGSAFAVSRPAMQKVVDMFLANQKEWEDYTDRHWAGDCVLGKAFKDSGTSLTRAWPIWQGDDIGNMNYGRSDNSIRLWCRPTVSYHHLSPNVVEEMWLFEQDWISKTADTSKSLYHKDVYTNYVLPRIRASQTTLEWDNHSEDDQGPVHSLEACQKICRAIKHCLQYSLSYDLRCMISSRPNLGEWARGVDSGWIYDRMVKFADDAEACPKYQQDWIK